MNSAVKILIGAAFLALATTGCYTKLYRPGMEQAGTGPYGQIYNRYDSSAIDTTLTEKEYQSYDTYPYYDNWSYWGRPRGRTLWGFDFYNYSPDYYWSYYGYYDYYGRPWWDSWYNRGYWGSYPYYGGSGGPAEPPSRQPGDRGRGGGSYGTPPPAQGGGTYVPAPADPAPQPQPQPPKQGTPPPKKQPSGSDSNQGSSGSGRGR